MLADLTEHPEKVIEWFESHVHTDEQTNRELA